GIEVDLERLLTRAQFVLDHEPYYLLKPERRRVFKEGVRSDTRAPFLPCLMKPLALLFDVSSSPWNKYPAIMQRPSNRSLALWFILCLSTPCFADDWPQWLGPNRDSVWRESGIVQQFPTNGPAIRWRTNIGGGYAGPAVAGGF